MPWDKVTIFQVDERVAPDGDPDRNLAHLYTSLPPGAHADVRPMPVTRAGDRSIPAGRISSANALVIADEAAAGTMVR